MMFLRQARDYRLTMSQFGDVQGTEAYISVDDNFPGAVVGTAMPTVGSTTMRTPDSPPYYGSAWAGCICRSQTAELVDGDTNTVKWTFTFSTKEDTSGGGGDPGDIAVIPPGGHTQFRAGAEMQTVEDPSSTWTWDLSGGAVEQPLSRLIVVGAFSLSSGLITATQFDTWFGTYVKSKLGKINSVAFKNFERGQVMFSSIQGGTRKQPDGTLKYVLDMNFDYRIVPYTDVEGNAITAEDWLYLWRATGSVTGFDKPITGTNQYLFAFDDFTTSQFLDPTSITTP